MEIRKLVKSGPSSLVIAVPQDFVKRNRLKAGDHIYLEDQGDHLELMPKPTPSEGERKEKVIDIEGISDKILFREITAAYLDDYFMLTLKARDIKPRAKNIKEMISNMVAFEVIDESSEKIVARSFLNIADSDIRLIIRRMDNIVRSMMIDVKDAFMDSGQANAIYDRDREVNKLNHLVCKVLKKIHTNKSYQHSLGISDIEVLRYWELNNHLEKVGDRIKNIALSLSESKRSSELLKVLEGIEALYLTAMKAFYTGSIKLADEVSIARDEFNRELSELLKKRITPPAVQAIVNTFNVVTKINDIGRIIRYI